MTLGVPPEGEQDFIDREIVGPRLAGYVCRRKHRPVRQPLQVGRAEVGRLASNRSYPRLRSVIRGVCASRPGKLLFTHLYPRPNECAVGDNLYANDIAIEPRKLALTLEGSGFVLKNNTARPSSFWSAFMGNPVIAAFVAALVFAVAGPVWRLWTGRNM